MRFSWVLVVPFVLLFPSSGAALVEVTKPVPVPASAPLSQEERARLREDLMRFADAFGAPGQAPATQAQSAVEPGPSKAEVSEGFHHKSALRSGCPHSLCEFLLVWRPPNRRKNDARTISWSLASR